MATRSTISIHQNDGTIQTVYCHWDGYYEHNGVLLYNFYNTAEKVKKLISYGAISSLGSHIGKKHDSNNIYDGCTFYHRDRGDDKDIRVLKVGSDVNPYSGIDEEEYNYIFVAETGRWIVKSWHDSKYRDLGDVLKTVSFRAWIIGVNDERQYKTLKKFYLEHGLPKEELPELHEVLYEI